MLYTGARTGEALWLDWRDVELTRAHVQFPKTKNGDARGVGLHPRAIAALANLKGRTGEVFRRPDGKPYSRPEALTTHRLALASRRRSGPPAGALVSRTFIRTTAGTRGRLALPGEPRYRRTDEAGRLEERAHGDALCARERRRIATHNQQASWGKSRGLQQEKDNKAMNYRH